MKSNDSYIFLAASAALLIVTGFLLSEIPALFNVKVVNNSSELSIVNKSLAIMNNALKQHPKNEQFTYSNTFESPYRKKSADQPSKPTNAKSVLAATRPKLLLKGVLLKSNSLAIIEDERGETYIRGIGDTIIEQQSIVSIKENRVILRDRQGSYELAVEER